jgi:hypothetical protein
MLSLERCKGQQEPFLKSIVSCLSKALKFRRWFSFLEASHFPSRTLPLSHGHGILETFEKKKNRSEACNESAGLNYILGVVSFSWTLLSKIWKSLPSFYSRASSRSHEHALLETFSNHSGREAVLQMSLAYQQPVVLYVIADCLIPDFLAC